MIKRFQAFLSEGDGGGGGNLVDNTAEVAEDNGTNENEKTGFLAAVSDEIFNEHKEELKEHKNINTILKEHFELKKKMSSAVVKPGENASEEEVVAYKKSMNIPLTAEDYDLGEVPEGASKSEEFDSAFKQLSSELGLSVEQAKGVFIGLKTLEVAGVKAKAEADKKAREEATREIRSTYGDRYDGVMAKVTKVLNLGGKDFVGFLNESGLGNDPRMTKVMAAIGDLLSEDSLEKVPGEQEATKKSIAERMYPGQGK